MKRTFPPLCLSLGILICLAGFACKRHEAAGPAGKTLPPLSNTADSLPFELNLREFYTGSFHADRPQEWLYEDFHGSQEIDGLPFDVSGYAEVYGERNLQWHKGQLVQRDFTNIMVARKFEELHLIHEARWREAVGCTIATIRLNYDDGSHADFPIKYGVHVQDISRLLTEEKESLTDQETKIIWRGKKPTAFDVNYRLYKTRLTNPHPEKLVISMDIINARSRASYVLAAATVANADAKRPLTTGLPINVPLRNYDGSLIIRVLDDATGVPLADVDCDPWMKIDKSQVVGDPVLTSETGEAVFKYPVSRTSIVGVALSKSGYLPQYGNWKQDSIPPIMIYRMKPLKQAEIK